MDKWRKFRTMKRGYRAFLVLTAAYVMSFFLPLLINNKPLMVRYHGQTYFPIARYYPASQFGGSEFGEADYRELRKQLEKEGSGWVKPAWKAAAAAAPTGHGGASH